MIDTSSRLEFYSALGACITVIERLIERERKKDRAQRKGRERGLSFWAIGGAELDRPSITKYPPSLRGGGGCRGSV